MVDAQPLDVNAARTAVRGASPERDLASRIMRRGTGWRMEEEGRAAGSYRVARFAVP
jgi:hypothetical protein